MDDERLTRLEEVVRSVSGDIADMKTAMKDIAAAMKSLAVLEEKQNATAEAFRLVYKTIEKNTNRITETENDIPDDLKRRLTEIEAKMPNIVLASGWVFKAAIGVMAIMGTASLLIVAKAILMFLGFPVG